MASVEHAKSVPAQYHVTLRSPIYLKIGGVPVAARSADATIDEVLVPEIAGAYVFRAVKVWRDPVRDPTGRFVHETFVIKQCLIVVPPDNIAGMVPQPFDK